MKYSSATYWLRFVATISILAMVLAIPVRQVEAYSITYTVTDLGTLGGPTSFANALNNQGQIVGVADIAAPDPTTTCAGLPANAQPKFHGFLWQRGVMHDLQPFGSDADAVANGINARGQVAGNSGPLCISLEAVLWQDGTPTNLGTLGTVGPFHGASGINNRGEVVGGSGTNVLNHPHAFLWQKGTMADLGTLGGDFSFAAAINEPGSVVGTANNTVPDAPFGGQQNHAFLWQKGAMSDLGTLGGPDSNATAINNRAQIVGNAYNTTTDPSAPFTAPEFRAVIWQRGAMQVLAPYGNEPDSGANGINEQGQVVGASGTFSQPVRAVLWRDRNAIDLNTLIPAKSGWQLLSANAINERGQIVGFGINPTGQFRGFLLSPTTQGGPTNTGAGAATSQTAARLASLPPAVHALLNWGRPNLSSRLTP